MTKWEDYYEILQVHFLAEPEIIEITYKKLAKMYHPDVNKNLDTTIEMQKINIAYDTLKNPVKRQSYHADWLDKNKSQINSTTFENNITFSKEYFCATATKVLNSYFSNVFERKFQDAYKLISSIDKKLISKNDFIRWQTTVSKIFYLNKFQIKPKKVHEELVINSITFQNVIEFIITTTEKNLIMDRLETDEVKKFLISENNEWKIFLGYQDIYSLTKKFENILSTSALSQSNNLQKVFKSPDMDPITNFHTKKVFLEKSVFEIERFRRYGNVFSLLFIKFDYSSPTVKLKWSSARINILKHISKVISDNIRMLDIPCRWSTLTFVLLLPETSLSNANLALEKILNKFENDSITYKGSEIILKHKTSVLEHSTLNITDTIKKLKSNLI